MERMIKRLNRRQLWVAFGSSLVKDVRFVLSFFVSTGLNCFFNQACNFYEHASCVGPLITDSELGLFHNLNELYMQYYTVDYQIACIWNKLTVSGIQQIRRVLSYATDLNFNRLQFNIRRSIKMKTCTIGIIHRCIGRFIQKTRMW